MSDFASKLRALDKAATGGDWWAGHFGSESNCDCRYILCDSFAGSIAVMSKRTEGIDGNDAPPEDQQRANMDLLVHLRNAAPQLAALVEALECEEAYSHARSGNEWMGPLSDAGWDGKSNPRPFINKLRRAALAALEA